MFTITQSGAITFLPDKATNNCRQQLSIKSVKINDESVTGNVEKEIHFFTNTIQH